MSGFVFDAPSADKKILEEGLSFTPKFDDHGLVTAVVTDARDGELLMVAHMNAEAIALTLESGIAHYFSRSRAKIWKKGESSGNLQTVKEIRVDCDQDALLIRAEPAGPTCHTGARSCFYRQIDTHEGEPVLKRIDT